MKKMLVGVVLGVSAAAALGYAGAGSSWVRSAHAAPSESVAM